MGLSVENSFIDIHTHSTKKEGGAIEIINLYPEQVSKAMTGNSFPRACSIGWHPWYIREDQRRSVMEILGEASNRVEVVAIGECGIDLLSKINPSFQLSVFKEHVRLAEEVRKPLIIHCVRAFNQLVKCRKEFRPTIPWIIHGYNSNLSIANELMKHGFYFSLGKALLDDTSNATKLFPTIPPDQLFLETDDADLPIQSIYHRAALLSNVTLVEFKKRMIDNYDRSFKNK